LRDCSRPLLACGRSVQQDWRAWLPEEKAEVFHNYEHRLESLYNMFSVSLNEAIELDRAGLSSKSLGTMVVTSELCERLTCCLAGMLWALHEHAKHYGIVPNAAPMDAANYQRPRGQRSARLSGMLNRVLLSQRLQFLHKVSSLQEMVEDLDDDFQNAVGDLTDGACLDPERVWHEVDADHYDINTCLRETIVVFKSFLVVLPVGQLGTFQNTVRDQSQVLNRQTTSHQQRARHGRMAAFAGE
jgi:hypothetical protein